MKLDLKTIDRLLASMVENLLKEKDRTYLETIRKVNEQQVFIKRNKTHSVLERIVSIHQPHVRPIVRGKGGVRFEDQREPGGWLCVP